MRSIQSIIMESKRDKQIGRPKTTVSLDSDKQKQALRKTRKTRTKGHHRHYVKDKTKLQNSKTLTKQNSKMQVQQGLRKLSKNTTKTEIDPKCTKQGKSRRVETHCNLPHKMIWFQLTITTKYQRMKTQPMKTKTNKYTRRSRYIMNA